MTLDLVSELQTNLQPLTHANLNFKAENPYSLNSLDLEPGI